MKPSSVRHRGTRVAGGVLLALVALSGAGPAAAQQNGIIAGRVLDAESAAPLANVQVSLFDSTRTALTDEQGRFVIAAPAGAVVLRISHLQYGDHVRAVVVQPGMELPLEVRLPRVPVQLDPVVVEAPTTLEERRVSTGNSMNELQAPQIQSAAREGKLLGQLLDQSLQGVRVRAGAFGAYSCVEYRGAARNDEEEGCADMAVFLDGIPVSTPAAVYGTVALSDVQRVEALSPSQAGAMYGGVGGAGVLLIETRRGPAPGAMTPRTARDVVAVDWSLEQRRYPWEKVFGGALLGNGLGVGLSVLAASACFSVRETSSLIRIERDTPLLGISEGCSPVLAALAGFAAVGLPGLLGSYATRWSGGTERSRGQVLPSMVTSAISVALGYGLLIHGKSDGTDSTVRAGTLVLAVGTPLLLTLSDRLFRVLR